MPRQKKQHLKQRPDGRFACRYKNLWFYGASDDEALQARDDYKRLEKSGAFISQKAPTIAEYAEKWLPREKVNAAYSTYSHAAIQIEKLLNAIAGRGSYEPPTTRFERFLAAIADKMSSVSTGVDDTNERIDQLINVPTVMEAMSDADIDTATDW